MSEEQAPRGVFVIDGEECPFPELGEGFTMEEAMVFYDYAGFPIEELFADEDDADEELERKRRSPGVIAALMHLAYARTHPRASRKAIERIVRTTDWVKALEGLASALGQEVDERPPGEAPKSSDSSSASSGDGSTHASARPDVPPSRTTTFESATPAISGHAI
jgi:hypothetical protein